MEHATKSGSKNLTCRVPPAITSNHTYDRIPPFSAWIALPIRRSGVKIWIPATRFAVAFIFPLSLASANRPTRDSHVDLPRIYGKIQLVNSFPDFEVQIVDAFADLHVEKVTAFPDAPGKWQFVESFPDYKIQIVNSFPDFKIKYVETFPGVAK